MKPEYVAALASLETAILAEEAGVEERKGMVNTLGVIIDIGDRIATALEERNSLSKIEGAVSKLEDRVADMTSVPPPKTA